MAFFLGFAHNTSRNVLHTEQAMVEETRAWPGKIYSHQRIDSTNAEAARMLRDGAAQGDFAVTAHAQSAGRGRMERAWSSEPNLGLYASIVCQPDVAAEQLPQITLVTAVAAAKAIRNFCHVDVAIKWPNDLYYQGKKLAGILTQTVWQTDAARPTVIIGIGINVHHEPEDFPEEIRSTAVSLKQITRETIDREGLLAALLDSFHSWREQWQQDGFATIRREWLALDCTVGKKVTLPESSGKKAQVTGISEFGELVLEDDTGKQFTIIAGDVVL